MKKTLYTLPTERMPRILENSAAVKSIIKSFEDVDFVDETTYANGEEFIYMISPFGVTFHYEYIRKPQVSLYGDPSKIECLEKLLSEKFFASEYAQTTIK